MPGTWAEICQHPRGAGMSHRMGTELKRLRKSKKTLRKLMELLDREDHVLVVHYSCESFYDRPDGQTPRVTSIAVRNLSSGQTASFSIHKVAEHKGIPLPEIEKTYDELEKEMLAEFYTFVNAHANHDWVHWNMRDINYGFAALKHRFRVLKGNPVQIEESRRFDLARALVAIYGTGYVGHPRLEKLMKKNDITDMDFLSGAEEASAFDNKEYVRLHQSTLRKVDILANIFGRAANETLKTNAYWYETYGVHPKAWAESVAEHWFVVLVLFGAAMIGLLIDLRNIFAG